MAAHKLTGLRQTVEDAQRVIDGKRSAESFLSMMRGALELSCWTEDLSIDEWAELDKLAKAGNIENIRLWAQRHIPAAIEEWEMLGRPSFREAWCAAVWKRFLGKMPTRERESYAEKYGDGTQWDNIPDAWEKEK